MQETTLYKQANLNIELCQIAHIKAYMTNINEKIYKCHACKCKYHLKIQNIHK